MEQICAYPDVEVAQQSVREFWAQQAVVVIEGLQHKHFQFPGFTGEVTLVQEGHAVFGAVTYRAGVVIEKMALEPLNADKGIAQALPVQAQYRGQFGTAGNPRVQ